MERASQVRECARELARDELPSEEARAWSSRAESRRPLVLIVEHDPETSRSLARFFASRCDVVTTDRVDSARRVLSGLSRLELALIDRDLLGESGIELWPELHHWSNAIVALMTATEACASPMRSIRPRIQLVLSKPISLLAREALVRASRALCKN